MYSKQEILEHLEEDKIRNISLINFIREYPVYDIKPAGDSVLVRGKSDENWVYISSTSEREFQALIKDLGEEDKFFAVMEDWMLPYLTGDREPVWQLTCIRLYHPGDIPMPESACRVTGLRAGDARYIFENYGYKYFTTPAYIAERISRGLSLGIRMDNKLVAWIMTHDDGAMGFLHVLDDYRRKGYAADLTLAMMNGLREEGKTAFVHIEENNEKSLNLASKLGFVKDRRIHWLQRSK